MSRSIPERPDPYAMSEPQLIALRDVARNEPIQGHDRRFPLHQHHFQWNTLESLIGRGFVYRTDWRTKTEIGTTKKGREMIEAAHERYEHHDAMWERAGRPDPDRRARLNALYARGGDR